jgi:hypothetical protein
MSLPLDVARCSGARINNEEDQALMTVCMQCERRKLPKNTKVRYLMISAPLFKNGECRKQIKEET